MRRSKNWVKKLGALGLQEGDDKPQPEAALNFGVKEVLFKKAHE